MSYVQGTIVRLYADFYENTPGHQPITPSEIVLTVVPPSGASFEATLSGGEIEPDPDRPGRFFYRLDTSPEAGTWRYQFEDDGQDKVVRRKALTVSRSL